MLVPKFFLSTSVLSCLFSPAIAQVVSPGAGCTTCQANEVAVIDAETVAKGRYTYTAKPTCQPGPTDDLKKAISGIGQALIKDYAGAITALIQTDEFRGATDQIHGDVGKILNGGKTDTATCQVMCNIVPTGSKITGYAIHAGDSPDKLQKCIEGKDCPIGWSQFTPVENKVDAPPMMQCVTFMNWSSDKDRTARLVTFFTPPVDWVKSRDF